MSSGYSFQASAHWAAGRRGTVAADPAAMPIEFSAPPEFRGEAGYWTPEHFLLAAVASCFVTTFRAIAELSKFDPVHLEVSAEGAVEKGEGGFAFTQVVLKPELTIHQESDRQRAMRLLEKAERSCLISRSLKAAVCLEAQVLVDQAQWAEIVT